MNDLETLLEPLVESAPEPAPIAAVRERAARVRRRRRARSGGIALLLVVALVAGIALATPRDGHGVRTIAPPPATTPPRPVRIEAPRSFEQYGMDIITAYGSLWLSQGGRVARVDPGDGRVVASIPVRGSSDHRSLAAGAGSIWVDDTGTAAVTRIDARTNRVVATIALLQGQYDPDGLAFLDGRLFVVRPQPEGSRGDVVAIDPATNRVARRAQVTRTFDIVAGADALWYVSDSGTFSGGDLIRIDPHTLRGTVVRHQSVHAIVGIAGRGIWVETGRGVVELDQRSGARIGGVIRLGLNVNVKILVYDGVLWLAAQGNTIDPGSVTAYDVATHRTLSPPVRLIADPPILGLVGNGRSIWVLSYATNGLARLRYTR